MGKCNLMMWAYFIIKKTSLTRNQGKHTTMYLYRNQTVGYWYQPTPSYLLHTSLLDLLHCLYSTGEVGKSNLYNKYEVILQCLDTLRCIKPNYLCNTVYCETAINETRFGLTYQYVKHISFGCIPAKWNHYKCINSKRLEFNRNLIAEATFA